MSDDTPAPVAAALTLPTVIAERCVHTRLAQASCHDCVDACPLDAWVIDDDTLGIDAGRCDGCGLCASICPQGAILSQRVAAVVDRQRGREAAFACEMTRIEARWEVIPCLHALGLNELLRMYRRGTRQLNATCSDCRFCQRNGATQLVDHIARINRMLAGRNLTPIKLQIMAPAQWKNLTDDTRTAASGADLARRRFFRTAAGASLSFAMGSAPQPQENAFVPPGKVLPRTRPEDIVPFAPAIDPAKCSGCDACARLCPHGAIALHGGDGKLEYRFDAESCTGCAMCTDVCQLNAVSVATWTPQTQSGLKLSTQHCAACGAPFHVPEKKQTASDLCFVCSKINHARNLYQVIA